MAASSGSGRLALGIPIFSRIIPGNIIRVIPIPVGYGIDAYWLDARKLYAKERRENETQLPYIALRKTNPMGRTFEPVYRFTSKHGGRIQRRWWFWKHRHHHVCGRHGCLQ